MKPEQNEAAIVSLLRESENRIVECCYEIMVAEMELSECEAENDQLFADCRALDNILNKISNRVSMVASGYSEPMIAIGEIEDIINESK